MLTSSDNDSFAGQGDPHAGEQGEHGQNGKGTRVGPSSDQATPDQDDSGPRSTCLRSITNSQSVYREIKEDREVVNTFPILATEGYVVLWGSEEDCFTSKEVRSSISCS